MAFQPVYTASNVEMRYTLDGQQVENVFNVINTVQTVSALQSIADTFVEWFTEKMSIYQSNTLALREVVVTDITVQNGNQVTSVVNLPQVGKITDSQHLPNNVTFCLQLKTSKRGRSYRGRSYVTGLVENQTNASHLPGNFIAELIGAYEDLIDRLNANNTPLGIVSRKQNKVKLATGVITEVTSVVAIDDVVDSQNRRLPGRGK